MKNNLIRENYLYNSAGRKMIMQILTAKRNEEVGSVLNKSKNEIKKVKLIDYVYVVDKNNNLIGIVSIKDILDSSKNTKIEDIMKTNFISVSPETDQMKVADLAVKHNIKAIPVVRKKKLLGVISSDEILSILNKSLREDIIRLAGIHKSHLKYENTLAVPFFLSIVHRLPWLIIGLIGISLAAIFISMFETTLESYLILAFFMPAIVYMSSALGIQHQMLFIRDLAVLGKEINIKLYFLRQMIIGLLLGLILSFIVFFIILLFWKQPYIAFVIAASMFITLIVSSFTALMTPLIMNKSNLDPALGSGPFAAIVSDITSIVIYFAIAYLLLGI